MTRLFEIIGKLEEVAPKDLKEPWDNVGLMVGDESQEIEKVFVCLDLTTENVKDAIDFGADLIVSHHPMIFKPLYSVTESDPISSMVRKVIKNDISVFSMHTNFDKADGGMNDILAQKLGLEDIRKFTDEECVDGAGIPFSGIGRVGMLECPISMSDLVSRVKSTLGCTALKYSGDLFDTIRSVALCSGSGGKEGIYSAFHSGADAYVTADMSHEHARLAYEFGLNIIDAGHFETENIICDYLTEFFATHFPELEVMASNSNPFFKSL